MHRNADKQNSNIFKGVGYGLLISIVIIAIWVIGLSMLI